MTSAALGAAAVIGLGLSVLPARAAYVVDMMEVADPVLPHQTDVVALGRGTIDLAGLSFDFGTLAMSRINPSGGRIITGIGNAAVYSGPISASTFGDGGLSGLSAATSSGDPVGVDPAFVVVPFGYVSGNPLSGSSLYSGGTFRLLGVTPGTYTWTWGASADDSFTLVVSVPEPSTWAMMLAGFGLLGFAAMRRGKREPRLAV
jgi:hypothetical protein